MRSCNKLIRGYSYYILQFEYFIYYARPNDDVIALNGMNKVILYFVVLSSASHTSWFESYLTSRTPPRPDPV